MPKDVGKGVSCLPVHPGGDMGGSAENQQKRSKKWYRREQWVYGFHLKNRHCRLIAQKYGFPWEKRPLKTLERVIDQVWFESDACFRLSTINYGHGVATIIFFVESDGRKRIKNSLCSAEEIDKVRKALGLPKGTKPKWYNCGGCDGYDNAADSSDDEPLPVSRAPVPPPLIASELIDTSECFQDSDLSMAGDKDFEDDSDETSSDDSTEDGANNEE